MRSALLFVCCCGCLAAQQASIEGTAVNALTHEPLSDVHIRLAALSFNGITAAYGAISDRAGHFSIATIRPGTYLQLPERSGFLFVNTRPQQARMPSLTLKPGEHRTDWVVEMMPRAVLTGRVVDENGDPVQGVFVRTVALSPDTAPQVMGNIPSVGTDDHGEFRIVTAPGRFYLQAEFQAGPLSDRPELRPDGSAEPVYGTTFYPNSVVKDRAAAVEAVAGKDVGGLEIRLQRQRGISIHGTVSGIPENSEGRTTVMLQFGESAQRISGSRGDVAGPDGKFSFIGVQPGFYRLYAAYGPAQMASRTVELQVENSDPPNVDLVLTRGVDLAGTLVIEGDPPVDNSSGKPAEKRTVRLEPAGPGAGFAGRLSASEVDGDGAFRIEKVMPVKFRVRVEPLPENAYIKTVDLDGVVSTDGTVDCSAGQPSHLKVTASRNGARISGTVRDENGEALLTSLVLVLLVQDPKNIQPDATKRVMADGKYTFQGVRPGKYRLLAVDSFRMAGNDSMETLRKLSERGEEIEIKEGDRIDKDLRLLPNEEANAQPKQ